MKSLTNAVFSLSLVFVLAEQASAHSGRTNSAGCHAGKLPYHCHSGGTYTDPEKARRLDGTYRPSKSSTSRKYFPQKSSPRSKGRVSPSRSKVTVFYDKIVARINNMTKVIRKKPYIVKSCDEWVMVARLMVAAWQVDADETKDIGIKCHQIGLRKFGEQMRYLMH